MSATTFDTLAAARNLEAAGIERAQAEAFAAELRVAAGADHDVLATKGDIAALEGRLDARLAATKGDIAAVKGDLAALEGRLDAGLAAVKGDIAALDARLAALKWIVAIQGAIGLATLTAVLFLAVRLLA